MNNFFGYSLKDLEAVVEAMGAKRYNVKQLFGWVYQHGVLDFHAMSNLSKPLRSALA